MSEEPDEPEMIECQSCDFQFTVIWNNDAVRHNCVRLGLPVVEYCPACGDPLED